MQRERRWWRKMEAAYRAAGGWAGPATLQWVRDKAAYLSACGVTARAAGTLLAQMEALSPAWAAFVIGGGPTFDATYEVAGIGKAHKPPCGSPVIHGFAGRANSIQ